jgi:hypothetical protein
MPAGDLLPTTRQKSEQQQGHDEQGEFDQDLEPLAPGVE